MAILEQSLMTEVIQGIYDFLTSFCMRTRRKYPQLPTNIARLIVIQDTRPTSPYTCSTIIWNFRSDMSKSEKMGFGEFFFFEKITNRA